VRTIFDKSPA